MIPEAVGKRFLGLARSAIVGRFTGVEPHDELLKKEYSDKRGVFVTLHRSGKLRGCIGYPESVLPLYDALIDASLHAAFADPRFPPVDCREMEKIEIEISVLTKPKLMEGPRESYPQQITPGKDGLIIRGQGSGLLLPQVAFEWGADSAKFLEMVCEKAMLLPDAWKDERNSVFSFQAQIFRE